MFRRRVEEEDRGIEKERQKPNLTPEQIAEIDNRSKAAKRRPREPRRSSSSRRPSTSRRRSRRARSARACSTTRRGRTAPAGADAGAAYAKLIAEFPDLALSVEARLELAELLAEREKPDDAIKLLREAIDKEPTDKPTPPETLERIRLRLGGVLFDKKDYAGGAGAVRRGRGERQVAASRAGALPLGRVPPGAGEDRRGVEEARDLPRQRRVPQHRRRERPRRCCGSAMRCWHSSSGTRPGRRSRPSSTATATTTRGRWMLATASACAFQNQGKFDEAVNAYAPGDAS